MCWNYCLLFLHWYEDLCHNVFVFCKDSWSFTLHVLLMLPSYSCDASSPLSVYAKKCIIEIKWFCVTCYFYFTNHPVFFCVLLLYGQHVMSCPYKPKEHLCWNKEFCSKFSQKCNNKLGNHLHSYLRSNQGKGHFQINLKKSLIWQNLLSVLQFINEGKWFTPNVSDFIMSLLKCKN